MHFVAAGFAFPISQVVFWVSVPASGGKPARMQYLTVAVRKPGTQPRVAATLTKQKGECIAEMSDTNFFKVYSVSTPQPAGQCGS